MDLQRGSRPPRPHGGSDDIDMPSDVSFPGDDVPGDMIAPGETPPDFVDLPDDVGHPEDPNLPDDVDDR